MTSAANGGEAPPAPGPPMTGGAAILARLRAQRAASSGGSAAAAGAPKQVLFLYASQTGTGQEIAKSLAADAAAKGIKASAMSCNELGWPNFTASKAPVVVFVASSTGDGDPPDSSAAFYVALKKGGTPKDHLAGVKFTVLGLGDSNYTRFMYVPRVIRSRLVELGATEFYPGVEADEVDGIEDKVDPWCEGIWGPIKAALAGGAAPAPAHAPAAAAAAAPAPAAAKAPAAAAASAAAAAAAPVALIGGLAPAGVDLAGVPALAPPRVAVVTDVPAEVAAKARAREAERPSPEALAHRDAAGDGLYSAAAPFWARVAGARLLSAPGSDRVVIHTALDIGGSGMAFTAGDSIGLLPENDPPLVDALLARLGLEGDAVINVTAADGSPAGGLLSHLAPPTTLRAAFGRGCDVTGVPRKSLLRLLAEHCADEAEKRTLLFYTSRAGREAYAADITAAQPTLVDLLNRFKSCAPPLAALLDALPPLAPRMYSICCAPGAADAAYPAAGAADGAAADSSSGSSGPRVVEFAFSAVTVTTPSGPRPGVATGWLRRALAPWLDSGDGDGAAAAAAAAAPVYVPVFLRPSDNFGPPASLATPLIMVGPGTGVAPFRGFLQQRAAAAAAAGGAAAEGSVGAAWLYFGCRRREEDYLYGPEFEGFEGDGTLAKLRVAFSRAGGGEGGGKKVYVQHLMAEDGAALAGLITGSGAHVYVCGDGAAMAKDVHATLAGLLAAHGGLAGADERERAAAAEKLLKEMAAAGRYVRDVWCA